MPVIDGVFVPRSPLTAAELHVDFLRHNTHVLRQRANVERAARAKAHRLADALATFGDLGATYDTLTDTLAAGLDRTARFGFREAQREIASLRREHPATAALNLPAPERLPMIVRGGLAGIRTYIHTQAVAVTELVIQAVVAALRGQSDMTLARQVAHRDAERKLHVGVLDLVGQTLNLGRTVGAASVDHPPTFALRSEQLDKATCDPCEALHGTIVRFGSPEYFAVLPPTGCLGGGRCRALMVFGDGSRQVRVPEQIAA